MMLRYFLVLVAILAVSGCGESEEEKEARLLKAAADKIKGFHCLSGWDGSHTGLKDRTERAMRNPDSFEHIDTRITPVSDSGVHKVFMRYRAQNGFGGMTVGMATATVSNYTCSLSDVVIE